MKNKSKIIIGLLIVLSTVYFSTYPPKSSTAQSVLPDSSTIVIKQPVKSSKVDSLIKQYDSVLANTREARKEQVIYYNDAVKNVKETSHLITVYASLKKTKYIYHRDTVAIVTIRKRTFREMITSFNFRGREITVRDTVKSYYIKSKHK